MSENNKTQMSPQEEKRLALRALIQTAVGTEVKLYFQPGTNLEMEYPCILYMRKDVMSERANNRRYATHDTYDVKYISASSDNDVIYKLLDIPMSEFDRRFVSDNLYHDVIIIHI